MPVIILCQATKIAVNVNAVRPLRLATSIAGPRAKYVLSRGTVMSSKPAPIAMKAMAAIGMRVAAKMASMINAVAIRRPKIFFMIPPCS